MPTLTSHSPSPAASPHNAFHIQPTRHFSPRPSPRQYPGTPKRTAHALPLPGTLSPATKKPREKTTDTVQPPIASRRPYADAGTQYSPDGYPPTAGSEYHTVAAERLRPAGNEAGVKKRKEASRSQSPPRQQMSGVGTAASSSAPRLGRDPPEEPDPRRDPSARTTPKVQHGDVSELPQRQAGQQDQQQPEAQEARSTHGHSSAPKRSRQDPGTEKLMPREYWTSNPKELGVLISNMLMELIRLNDQIPLRDGRLTRFHSRAPPGISVSDYLQRLIQHATLSPPILLSMVYYIDRLCALYPAFTINSLTVHRFLITAATVAAKGLSDSFWTNPTYARIGGIPVSELATLELELLQRVHWKIVPKPEVLVEYYKSLVERTQGFELEGGSSADNDSLDESDEGLASPDGEDRMSEAPT